MSVHRTSALARLVLRTGLLELVVKKTHLASGRPSSLHEGEICLLALEAEVSITGTMPDIRKALLAHRNGKDKIHAKTKADIMSARGKAANAIEHIQSHKRGKQLAIEVVFDEQFCAGLPKNIIKEYKKTIAIRTAQAARAAEFNMADAIKTMKLYLLRSW